VNEYRRQQIRDEIRERLVRIVGLQPINLTEIAADISERQGNDVPLKQYKDMTRIEADFLGIEYLP